MYKYTKEQMEGIEKMLGWFHSKAKTKFKFIDEKWGKEVGNNPLIIDANGQLIVDWMTRKVTQLEYDDKDKMLWNSIRELYMDNQKDGNAYMVTQIVRK